jgi:hypothetical protein
MSLAPRSPVEWSYRLRQILVRRIISTGPDRGGDIVLKDTLTLTADLIREARALQSNVLASAWSCRVADLAISPVDRLFIEWMPIQKAFRVWLQPWLNLMFGLQLWPNLSLVPESLRSLYLHHCGD